MDEQPKNTITLSNKCYTLFKKYINIFNLIPECFYLKKKIVNQTTVKRIVSKKRRRKRKRLTMRKRNKKIIKKTNENKITVKNECNSNNK